jgi:phosphoribosylformylglycinamidine synthase
MEYRVALFRGPFKFAPVRAQVIVMPKKSVLDPQGAAVKEAVHHHGMPEIDGVRIGKFMEIEIGPGVTRDVAEAKLHALCAELLSNPVIEDYRIEFAP